MFDFARMQHSENEAWQVVDSATVLPLVPSTVREPVGLILHVLY